jgi:hypothetical protein
VKAPLYRKREGLGISSTGKNFPDRRLREPNFIRSFAAGGIAEIVASGIDLHIQKKSG